MKRLVPLVMLLSVTSLGARADDRDLASWVDPFIGTMGSGFVFPGPAAPYGMVQLSPDTEGHFAYTGYQYIDRFIRGFSHVHTQSMGVQEGGEIPLMPTTGEIVTDVKTYQSAFDHALEDAEPGYYGVKLASYDITAELTAGLRVGLHRYTFPPTEQANVLLDIGRQIDGSTDDWQSTPGRIPASVTVVDDRTVMGTAAPPASTRAYTVHFAARFDRPFDSYGVWDARGAPLQDGVATVEGTGAGAAVTFDTTVDRQVRVKVGISFVSPQNALGNIDAELPGEDFDFEALRARTRNAWNDALSAITVEGGSPLDRTAFTTAMYHAQHHPNVFNDANGEYRGYDDAVHTIGEPDQPIPDGSSYYANFSMWDTYRAEMPLLMLIAPERIGDMMRSLAGVVEQGGRLPRWGWMYRYADFMNGEPALQVFADAFCRDLVPDDVLDTLYDDAVRLALVDRRNPDYLTRGYTDASGTLEHALGDFALALVADARGDDAVRDALLGEDAPAGSFRGSESWRNLFDPETHFLRPREADGSWKTPFLPEDPDGWREGTGWQYLWLVPHDLPSLFAAMGQETALLRYDRFFGSALTATVPYVWPEVQQKLTLYGIAYAGDQYAPSNEHDLQAPWVANWLGHPERTQAIQRAYQGLYRATPDGLPGNDDLGTMSAWFVWSALGMYPVIPGAPFATFGSPLFERATIDLPGDPFVIEAPGTSLLNKYVAGATLDDEPLERLWLTHDEMTRPGTLRFEMSPVPTGWGNGPTAAPPSASTHPVSSFGCAS